MEILDSSVTTGPAAEEPYYYWHNRVSNWQLKFAWLPHRCSLSNQFIWLKLAWRGTWRHGSGDTAITAIEWHSAAEHMIWLLKQ